MGQVSSCCSGAGDKESQVDITAPDVVPSSIPAKSSDAKNAFMSRFYEGVDVHLILQDKTKLICQVRLDRNHEFLLLSCDRKVRAIGMKDIKAILHTPEHLKRVESSAGIADAKCCAAIHLKQTGNCIPLFFTNPQDKQLFVESMEEARAGAKTMEPTQQQQQS